MKDAKEKAIKKYLKDIEKTLKTDQATEHSYRESFGELLSQLLPNLEYINEPKRKKGIGAPDFVLKRQDVEIGHIETKKIDENLDDSKHQEQFQRYRDGLPNLIITNFLKFDFYQTTQKTGSAKELGSAEIGTLEDGKIHILRDLSTFFDLLDCFSSFEPPNIESPQDLADEMAKRGRLMSSTLENALLKDLVNGEDSELRRQYNTIQKELIPDLTEHAFANLYAETICYGFFTAKYYDNQGGNFTREKAAGLMPETIPFLKKFFPSIIYIDLDKRIEVIVDSLANIFHRVNIRDVFKNFGNKTATEDPVLHFYETFLQKLDPVEKKSKGIYYTPQPVVSFIVRAVDDALKDHLDIKEGLSDTKKISLPDTKGKEAVANSNEVHRVQILDPATGTGTFLAEVIRLIHKNQYDWQSYVQENLIPRLHGFEVKMASYAIAHLVLERTINEQETKEHKQTSNRLCVYLTNALENHDNPKKAMGNMMTKWLEDEAKAVEKIKGELPVMVVLGNPPYRRESENKSNWIIDQIKNYKKEPGGIEKLNEGKTSLDDDYVKFIRLAEYLVEKNGRGVTGYITNRNYLISPTFRGMRWHLLKTFDHIYILDLHGDSENNKTKSGEKDENVFDITVGVTIAIFIKEKNKPAHHQQSSDQLASVQYHELRGERINKYEFLSNKSLDTIKWKSIQPQEPFYYLSDISQENNEEYQKGFSIKEIFEKNGTAISTQRDKIAYQFSKQKIKDIVKEFRYKSGDRNQFIENLKSKYHITKESRDQKVNFAVSDIRIHGIKDHLFKPVTFLPMDTRWTYYTGKLKGFLSYPNEDEMRHLYLDKNNIGLLFNRNSQKNKDSSYDGIFVSKFIADKHVLENSTFIAPLYVYPEEEVFGNEKQAATKSGSVVKNRTANLSDTIIKVLEKKIKLPFEMEIDGVTRGQAIDPADGTDGDTPTLHVYQPGRYASKKTLNSFCPLDIFDYIYGLLHSPSYRKKYGHLLRLDFSRVAYPSKKIEFWRVAKAGAEIRALHLLTHPACNQKILEIEGNDLTVAPIKQKSIADGKNEQTIKVQIGERTYLKNIPIIAWEFNIGGYQPAMQWLKRRKNITLTNADLNHYNKMLVALSETHRVMQELG